MSLLISGIFHSPEAVGSDTSKGMNFLGRVRFSSKEEARPSSMFFMWAATKRCGPVSRWIFYLKISRFGERVPHLK